MVHARELVEGYSRSNCEVAARTAQRVGLGHGVVAGLTDVYEHGDGSGGARHLHGDAIALSVRLAQVVVVASLFHGLGGIDVALEALRRRAGATLDPDLVNVVRDQPRRILDVPWCR